MSDDGDFYMDDAEEEYDFDYEGSEDDTGEADVENEYYTAKGLRADIDAALAAFGRIVDRADAGEFAFRALKQMTKLTFRHGRYDAALGHYRALLARLSGITRNYAEKTISGILDYVSADTSLGTGAMQQFYEVTMDALLAARNERLRTRTNLKLAKLWLDRGEFGRLQRTLSDLLRAAEEAALAVDAQGAADGTLGTLQLEIYALEIQMYNAQRNNKRLKEVYEKSLRVRSAIPHPRIQGVIRECGGKMYLSEGNYAQAQVEFFESFKSYDEAGARERLKVLKYLVLAYMLMGSEINPFDSQETKPYKADPEITAMTELVAAYQRRDVHSAEQIIRENATILEDAFVKSYIEDVLTSLRTQWILDVLPAYRRVELGYLARQLHVASADVEDIVTRLIRDGRVAGTIDQVSGALELSAALSDSTRQYESLARWSETLLEIQAGVLKKVNEHSLQEMGAFMMD